MIRVRRRAENVHCTAWPKGFTLVELLVSIIIILILSVMVLAAVNVAANGDRIPGAARQTQSMIEGARDRAIYAGQPRGVRFVKDPSNEKAVSSFVFIGAPEDYTRGTVSIEYDTTRLNWYITENGDGTDWARMLQRSLLQDQARIYVPADSPQWFTITDLQLVTIGTLQVIQAQLTRPYSTDTADTYSGNYRLELAPAALPNQEPRLLPRGTVIDLESSRIYDKIPRSWYLVTDDGGDGSTTPAARLNDDVLYSNTMDLMFNARGTVYGSLASYGVIHLLVADSADVSSGFRIHNQQIDLDGSGTADDLRGGDEVLISVFTHGGTIAVSPVDLVDMNADFVRDDPFYFAETGGEE